MACLKISISSGNTFMTMQKDILFQCKTENVVLAIGRGFLFFINFVHYSLFRPQSTYSDSMLFVILCLNSCSVSSLA